MVSPIVRKTGGYYRGIPAIVILIRQVSPGAVILTKLNMVEMMEAKYQGGDVTGQQ